MSEGGPYHINGKPVSRREYLTEHHGELIADVAERGRYGYSDEGWGYLYLRADSIIPRPERVSIEGVFPAIDVEALAAPSTQHRGLASWTQFLQWSPQIQDNDAAVIERDYSYPAKHFDSKAPKLVGKQYDILRDAYFAGGGPRVGAVADLRGLKDVARGSLLLWARQIAPVLDSLREVVAVLFLELWRAIDIEPETPWEDLPEERRNRLDSLERLFVSRWRDAIFGANRTWAIGSDITNWSWGWEDAPEVLYKLQGSRILSLWNRRDAIINEAFPVEVQRVACETILGKLARGEGGLPQAEPLEPWSKEDEKSLLPSREDSKWQSREAREDIVALCNLLNENEHRETKWSHYNKICQALAERKVSTELSRLEREIRVKQETDRLRVAIRRTLHHFGHEQVKDGETDEQIATQVRDWILRLGSAHT